jgi:Na+/proline symporter
MNRLRIAIGTLGTLAMLYAAWLALTGLGLRSIRLTIWLGGTVAIHDGVLVPATLALAWLGRRWLPRTAWAPAAAGLIVAGTLTILSTVVLLQPGSDPTLPSLLDRNYPAGYGVALSLVLALTAAISVHRVRSSRPSPSDPVDTASDKPPPPSP